MWGIKRIFKLNYLIFIINIWIYNTIISMTCISILNFRSDFMSKELILLSNCLILNMNPRPIQCFDIFLLVCATFLAYLLSWFFILYTLWKKLGLHDIVWALNIYKLIIWVITIWTTYITIILLSFQGLILIDLKVKSWLCEFLLIHRF